MSARVQVYRNLNKGGYSIRCAKTRKVIGYAAEVTLVDVAFKVMPSGQARARSDKQRNVHAWAEGTISSDSVRPGLRVSYNPFTDAGFVIRASGQAITSARALVLNTSGAFLKEP